MNKQKVLLWIIPKDNAIKYVTESEKSSEKLTSIKRSQYLQSRSYLRQILSTFRVEPLKVPLYADYGKIPYIPDEYGYISISHSHSSFFNRLV